MVESREISDFSELQRLSEILTSLTSDLGSRTFSTILNSGGGQLLLVRDANPVLRYKMPLKDGGGVNSANGLQLIERFLDEFSDLGHFTMLYDDPLQARKIEFQYVRNGLEKGERCLYAIANDDVESEESIRNQMDSFGIKTSHYLKNGDLYFWNVPDPAKDDGGFVSGCLRIMASMPQDQKEHKHIRLAFNMKHPFSTKEEFEGHAEFEGIAESKFANFPGSMMCSYYVGNFDPATHRDWMRSILQNHGVSLIVCSRAKTQLTLQDDLFVSLSVPTSVENVDKNGRDDKIAREIRNLSGVGLKRDAAEIDRDILFLGAQLKADLASYTPNELHYAIAKISQLKRERKR